MFSRYVIWEYLQVWLNRQQREIKSLWEARKHPDLSSQFDAGVLNQGTSSYVHDFLINHSVDNLHFLQLWQEWLMETGKV